MEWENTPESSNIEDRRGQNVSANFGNGGMGIGVILAVLVLSYFTGISPTLLMSGAQIALNQGASAPIASAPRPALDDRTTSLVRHVLGETEAVWAEILPAQKNIAYTNTRLVLYTGATNSGCGGARSAMGPFYCPNDKKIYLDTTFFQDMQRKYGGGGDFAYAYVIAHEVGHHVQDLLGTLDRADALKQQGSQTQANAISVRIELQADCLAGVWAANANKKWNLTNQDDIAKAVATAQAIGDDTLQKAARGYAVPDSFTHGSSALRQKWLTTGLQSGEIDSCATGAP